MVLVCDICAEKRRAAGTNLTGDSQPYRGFRGQSISFGTLRRPFKAAQPDVSVFRRTLSVTVSACADDMIVPPGTGSGQSSGRFGAITGRMTAQSRVHAGWRTTVSQIGRLEADSLVRAVAKRPGFRPAAAAQRHGPLVGRQSELLPKVVCHPQPNGSGLLTGGPDGRQFDHQRPVQPAADRDRFGVFPAGPAGIRPAVISRSRYRSHGSLEGVNFQWNATVFPGRRFRPATRTIRR